MAQYQSFPGAPGDSRTLEKLKALRLPSLEGKRFLDVGCNEGFFCGYAAFNGATRAVGIDHSAMFIQRAKTRFPACEFLNQGWDKIPEGPFDVILLASALHYADDQAALVRSLMGLLAPGGTLVLELGVVPGSANEWVWVKRGPDERSFPTMSKLAEVLAPYAYKQMGASVSQAGDPVPRFVMHIQNKKPFAYLLMQPPAYGKSTIARTLFGAAGVAVVSGDETISRIAQGALSASKELATVVQQEFSPSKVDRTLARVHAEGLGDELIRIMLAVAGRVDFVLDGYLPKALHERVKRIATEEGFVPVELLWEPAGPLPMTSKASDELANAYFISLGGTGSESTPSLVRAPPVTQALGYVDNIWMGKGRAVRLRGWAFDAKGEPATSIEVTFADQRYEAVNFERVPRPDVQQHHEVADPQVGYELEMLLDRDVAPREFAAGLVVRIRGKDGSLSQPLTVSSRALVES